MLLNNDIMFLQEILNFERKAINMGRLFGTDGVSGVANTELTIELAYKLGQAGAYILTKETQHQAKILVGKILNIR